GFLDVLSRMGAHLDIQARADGSADIRARHGALRATDIAAEEVPSLVDELPVLAVAAAHADGVTTVRGAGELRVKETDRIATLTRGLDLTVDERVVLDGHDVTDAIRGADVSGVVSQVAANPDVREEMVRRQRAWVRDRDGGVVEGRDIGTVVFPAADLKVFL